MMQLLSCVLFQIENFIRDGSNSSIIRSNSQHINEIIQNHNKSLHKKTNDRIKAAKTLIPRIALPLDCSRYTR